MSGTTEIQGTCDPEFELVRSEFAKNFDSRGEIGAGLCVTVEGRKAIDLWAGHADLADGRPWEADSRSVVFSATKGATALCAHLLADRGMLDLDAPVAEYWPEFAKNGKDRIRVSMMLDHSAGVSAISAPLSPGDMYDWDTMCDLIARQAPFWEPGTRHGYQLLTFGWTVGELVRRVSGRSLGTFFQDEVAAPLGLDFHIGLPEELEPKVAPIIVEALVDYDHPFTRAMAGDPDCLSALSFRNLADAGVDWNDRAFRAAEIGGAGGVASGQALALMYTPLALGGADLVSSATVARMASVASSSHEDATLLMPTRFSAGFMKSMDNRRTIEAEGSSVIISEAAFGHVGAGGSFGFADPREGMAFGYVMNRQGQGILLNDRGQALVDAVYRCLGYRTSAPGVWIR